MNLLTSHPGELMDYVNKPVGSAKAPPGPLKPLIAVPTTAGTGSESTAMCVLDILSMRVKTGISHWRLRPTMAVVDPLLTMTLPPEVTAASGLDIVCHALESYTARDYRASARKAPEDRVTYCGSNPVSDLWSEKDPLDDPSEQRPRALTELMRDIDMPNGLHACGFGAGDIDELVEGTMKQQRLLSTCPKDVAEHNIANIFLESLENW